MEKDFAKGATPVEVLVKMFVNFSVACQQTKHVLDIFLQEQVVVCGHLPLIRTGRSDPDIRH